MRTRVLLLVSVWMLTAAPNCRIGPPPPPPGALGVQFYQQEDWNQSPRKLCGPACIKMWQTWRYASSNSQTQIWQWIEGHYPAPISGPGGTSPDAIRDAAQYFVGIPTSFDIYAGPTEKRRGLADIIKNLDRHDPTIAIVDHGFHAALVVGASWHDLDTANPSVDFLWIHDPLRSPYMYSTIGDWMENRGTYCGDDTCMGLIQRSGSKYFAAAEYDEFEYLGGVYYGPPPAGATGRYKISGQGTCYWDANDSGPNQCNPDGGGSGRYKLDGQGTCYWDASDSGPDQCSPGGARRWAPSDILLALRNLLRAPGKPARASLIVRDGHVPSTFPVAHSRELGVQSRRASTASVAHPWTTKRAEIVENFWHGIASTRMDQVPRLDVLRSRDLIVNDVISVARISGGRGYHLLHLVDRSGRIAIAATVDEEGWLLEVEDGRDLTLRRPVALDTAQALVQQKRGESKVRAVRFVHGSGDAEPGASQFAPLAMVERDDATFYVNAGSEVFVEKSPQSVADGGPMIVRAGARGRLERVP